MHRALNLSTPNPFNVFSDTFKSIIGCTTGFLKILKQKNHIASNSGMGGGGGIAGGGPIALWSAPGSAASAVP